MHYGSNKNIHCDPNSFIILSRYLLARRNRTQPEILNNQLVENVSNCGLRRLDLGVPGELGTSRFT